MKKIGLGISILLFAAVFELCQTGLELMALAIAAAGLVILISGATEKGGNEK